MRCWHTWLPYPPVEQSSGKIRARDGLVRHLLGADSASIRKITEALQVHGEIEFYPVDEHNRKAVDTVRQIKVSHPSLSLRTDITESTIRAGLAAMAATARGEEAVLQIILGAAYPPSTIPKNLPDPNAGWLQAVLGNVSQASTETRKSIKEKAEQHSFQATIRIGVSGANAKYRINCILSALRTLEAAGVRIYDELEKPAKLNIAHVPWHFPLRLLQVFENNNISVKETYAKPAWICATFMRKGKKYCNNRQIPEKILIAKTKEVLGLPSLEDIDLKDYISEIVCGKDYDLTYIMNSGAEVKTIWHPYSRKDSWNEEMRQQARNRTLERSTLYE